MIFEFNGDEMVLVIIGVVRRVNPTMLKDDGDVSVWISRRSQGKQIFPPMNYS